MDVRESPPIPIADATPQAFPIGGDVLQYQVRFYATASATDELAQGGDRTVSIVVVERGTYDEAAKVTKTHTSTLAGAASKLVAGGEWQLVGTGLGGFDSIIMSAAKSTEPAGATHYRIRVRWR